MYFNTYIHIFTDEFIARRRGEKNVVEQIQIILCDIGRVILIYCINISSSKHCECSVH